MNEKQLNYEYKYKLVLSNGTCFWSHLIPTWIEKYNCWVLTDITDSSNNKIKEMYFSDQWYLQSRKS